MNATGVVEQLGTKPVNTKFGSKNTYSAKVGGQWYKFGFKNPGFAVGDNVALEYTPGTYGNEVSSFSKGAAGAASAANEAPAATAPRPAATGSSRAGVFPIPALDGQRAIVRQNALTNARELYCAAKNGGKGFAVDFEADPLNIIKMARVFEAYACGDMDMEAAQASLGAEKKAA